MNNRTSTVRLSLCLLLVSVCSFFTYFLDYQRPESLFWDENYHIASAQKYLNGVFFMEPHPPLGKLLIALGEYAFDVNPDDSQFLEVNQARDLPAGFSFTGYRFVPALLGWLTAPLFFLLLVAITDSLGLSLLLSSAYVFENAMIVHGRGAMLESIQIFFIVAALLAIASLNRKLHSESRERLLPYIAGSTFSAAVATKVTSLILVLAFLPLVWSLRRSLSKLLAIAARILLAFLFVQYLVWQIHFSLGTTILPKLQNKGMFRASPQYIAAIQEHDQLNPLNFPTMLRDSLEFFHNYEQGVPRLNLCKPEENGSSPMFWPFGGRSISYRWDRSGDTYRSLYLQVNPAAWALGLAGLVLALCLAGSRIFFGISPAKKISPWLYAYLAMWLCYMAVMLSVTRVMYLYHYFIPYLFSIVLAGITAPALNFAKILPRRPLFSNVLYGAPVLLIICAYWIYAPLTYGWPLTGPQYQSRALLSLWDLHCPSCGLTNQIAAPIAPPKAINLKDISISGIAPIEAWQEWGEPRQNRCVEGAPIIIGGTAYQSGIGTHAKSRLTFPVRKKFVQFSGKVGLPDYLRTKGGQEGSVIFEIWLDAVLIWRSPIMTPNNSPENFSVPVVQGEILELRTSDAGDGNENDHAVWADLRLE